MLTPTLCIACSSSLPPRPSVSVFLTPCCSRPICPNCLKSNPRLARYDPCLRCLGGVGVVQGSREGRGSEMVGRTMNVDGGVRDTDIYAIGDDEDEEDEGGFNETLRTLPEDQSSAAWQEELSSRNTRHPPEEDVPPSSPAVPSKYYIQPADTLHSISLRYKIVPTIICRLNNLPLSTLRSTPHLLHTRAFLTLPASTSTSTSWSENSPHREAKRKREIAESRFRNVTKEADWDIARAYVALAEHHSDTDDDTLAKEYGYERVAEVKDKPPGPAAGQASGSTPPALEERAVDRYMDDDEWEARERAEGRSVLIPKFPLLGAESEKKGKGMWSMSVWMRWRNGAA